MTKHNEGVNRPFKRMRSDKLKEEEIFEDLGKDGNCSHVKSELAFISCLCGEVYQKKTI